MALFDDKARTYDTFCETPLGHFVSEVEHRILASLAAPKYGEKAIDLGCGTGAYTMWLRDTGLHATGVDISRGMLEVARRKSSNDVLFVEANLTQLPFPDESFDLAISNVVLEFVPEPRGVVQEAYRILKPGGRLVVGFIGKNSPWGAKYTLRGNEDSTSVYHYARFFSYAEAASLGWRQPNLVEFGLYVGPHEFSNDLTAWQVENTRRAEKHEQGAGFFALRWDKDDTTKNW